MINDEKKQTDEEILKKYTRASGPEGLREALEGLWQQSKQDPSFASRKHFILYQNGEQESLIKIQINTNANADRPFVWYLDEQKRAMPKNVKETIAQFLWEHANEKTNNPHLSYEQWRDDTENNQQWMQNLARNELDLLREGLLPPILPKDLVAACDAVITAAPLPAYAPEAKLAANALGLPADLIAGPGGPGRQNQGLFAKGIGFFAHKTSPTQVAPKPQSGPVPEAPVDESKTKPQRSGKGY